jgi:Asp-tRNA(Asn)/Glu-tRNA(Gln) amidotransferase A subunit family amidase
LLAGGATVHDVVDEDIVAAATAAHPVVMAYEAARERADELAAADRLSEPLSRLLRTGATTSKDTYTAARSVIASASEHITGLLDDYDVILGPAAPGSAPRGLDATGDPILSRPWQAVGSPVVTVPGLRDGEGMPLGLQAVGRLGGELHLLTVSCWIERQLHEA